jgi:hypothetical protein
MYVEVPYRAKIEAQLQPIVQAMLQPTAAEPDRVAALCVFDDIIEHCSADGGATEASEQSKEDRAGMLRVLHATQAQLAGMLAAIDRNHLSGHAARLQQIGHGLGDFL